MGWDEECIMQPGREGEREGPIMGFPDDIDRYVGD